MNAKVSKSQTWLTCCLFIFPNDLIEGSLLYLQYFYDQNEADEGQEEGVVVDADSNDGAVLVNGNETEEWCTNNDGSPSA